MRVSLPQRQFMGWPGIKGATERRTAMDGDAPAGNPAHDPHQGRSIFPILLAPACRIMGVNQRDFLRNSDVLEIIE